MKEIFGRAITREKEVFASQLDFEKKTLLANDGNKLTSVLNSINIYHVSDYDGDTDYLVTEYDAENQKIISSDRYSNKDIEEYGWDKVKGWILEDTERLSSYGEEWSYMGVIAEAIILIPFFSGNKINFKRQKIQSGGLWGIETDIDFDQIKTEEDVQVEELLSYLETLNVKIGEFKTSN